VKFPDKIWLHEQHGGGGYPLGRASDYWTEVGYSDYVPYVKESELIAAARERDELKAKLAEEPNRTQYWMHEALGRDSDGDERDAAVRGVVAQRDELAGLLLELSDILSLCDQGRTGRVHDHMDMQAAACGERDGYGAWMDSLQRMWQARDPVGCFTVGPCLGTVRHAREKIKAALVKVGVA
jgi:hypothetical protein